MTISACWVHYETQRLDLTKNYPRLKSTLRIIEWPHEYFKRNIITKLHTYDFVVFNLHHWITR